MNQLKTKLVREITTHYSSAHLPSSSTPILPTIFDFENHHFKQAHEHKAQNTLTYKPKISHKPKTHIHRSKAHTYPSTNSLGQTTHQPTHPNKRHPSLNHIMAPLLKLTIVIPNHPSIDATHQLLFTISLIMTAIIPSISSQPTSL